MDAFTSSVGVLREQAMCTRCALHQAHEECAMHMCAKDVYVEQSIRRLGVRTKRTEDCNQQSA